MQQSEAPCSLVAALFMNLAMTAVKHTASAQGDSAVDFVATELQYGLHGLMARGRGNVVVSTGNDGVLLIDDHLETLGDRLIAALGLLAGRPVRRVVNTHWHYDHAGGNRSLAEQGALVLVHQNVRRRL